MTQLPTSYSLVQRYWYQRNISISFSTLNVWWGMKTSAEDNPECAKIPQYKLRDMESFHQEMKKAPVLKENGFYSNSFWNTQQGKNSSTADSASFQPSLYALHLLSTALPDFCEKKKSSHYHWEYCHETEKLMENMRHLLEAESPVEVGYVLMQMFKLDLLAWEIQLKVQEEREDTSEIHASAKEKKQMTEECMKRNENKEIIETGGKQEHGKRNQLDLFPDCRWSHYRNNILSPGFPQK